MPRVSSEEQAGDDRLSLPGQLREMRELCARQGWSVVGEYAAEFESAWTWDLSRRPALRAALVDALAGKFDVLLVADSTRFARNVELAQMVRRRCREAGVRIVDMDSVGFDTWTADGKFVTVIKDGSAEWWSDKISEATKRAKREAFARGLHLGDPPFGYRRAGPGAPLVVPAEASAVREGFRDYVAGASWTEIMGRWNAAGLRPRSKRGYTRFTMPAMQHVFENDFYAGFVTYKGERRAGAHEAIVSVELWEAAQRRVRRMAPRTKEPRMLSGALSCFECRGPLWQARKGRKPGTGPVYYRESSLLRGRECSRAGRLWRAEEIEDLVSGVFVTMSRSDGWLRRVDQEARRPRGDVAELAKVRRELQAEKARLGEVYIAGGMSKADWQRRAADVDGRLAALPAERPEAVLFAGERLRSIGQVWSAASTEQRRELCRVVFAGLWVDVREKRLWVEPWSDFRPSFEGQRAEVGCSLGPPGFEGSERPTWFEPIELGVAS